jgi:hypothetical protein
MMTNKRMARRGCQKKLATSGGRWQLATCIERNQWLSEVASCQIGNLGNLKFMHVFQYVVRRNAVAK